MIVKSSCLRSRMKLPLPSLTWTFTSTTCVVVFSANLFSPCCLTSWDTAGIASSQAIMKKYRVLIGSSRFVRIRISLESISGLNLDASHRTCPSDLAEQVGIDDRIRAAIHNHVEHIGPLNPNFERAV